MAATPSTLTTAQYILKEWYHGQQVMKLGLEKNVTLDLIPKDTNFTGDVMPLPLLLSASQGIASESLAIAQGASNTAAGEKFNITVGDTFSSLPLGRKALKAARNNAGAFVDHRKVEVDEHIRELGRNCSQQLWSPGGGSLGVISTISNTTNGTVVLTNKDQIVNIQRGMTIALSENDGTDAAHSLQSGTAVVTTVDYNTGTFVFSGTLTSGDAGDHIFRYGQFAGDVSQTILWKGIPVWVPASAATDTLFGLARTGQSQLSGVRLESSEETGQLNERIEKLVERMSTRYGTSPDCFIMHGTRWRELNREMQNQGIRVVKSKPEGAYWSHSSIMMDSGYGDGGELPCYADRDCPTTSGFALEKKYCKIWSMGDMISLVDEDGVEMLRAATTASFEMQFEIYANFACSKPTSMGRVSLA